MRRLEGWHSVGIAERSVKLVSVIIPTNRAVERLLPCLQALATQDIARNEIEVHVAWNGMSEAPSLDSARWPMRVVTHHLPTANIAAAKNQALESANGRYLLLLNDDVIPRPDFVRQHLNAQYLLERPGMVLGQSDWERYDDQRVWDELIATTPMIFFYGSMQPHAWHGFRHAWNLNLSLPRELLDGERFDEHLGPFFFEDIELAYRLEQRCDARVWYEPRAHLLHVHRYGVDDYFRRETMLGRAAVRLALCNADCHRAIYGAALDESYRGFLRVSVQQDGRFEAQRLARLRMWGERSASTLPGHATARQEMLELLYDAHLPLKRLAFRRGMLQALDAGAATPSRLGGVVARAAMIGDERV